MTHSDQFKPRCISGQCLGHSNKGYLVPCCFVDAFYDNIEKKKLIHHDNDKLNALWDTSLKISNNNHIHDITMSDIWMDFYTMLQDKDQEKPLMCIKCCDPVYTKELKEGEIAPTRFSQKTNPVHAVSRRSTEVTHVIKINSMPVNDELLVMTSSGRPKPKDYKQRE